MRTADPNDQACIRFAESNNELADLMYDGKGELTLEAWRQAHLDKVKLLDRESLMAEGAIAERMKAAVALIPPVPMDMVSTSGWRIGEDYNQAIAGIYTACEVDGTAYAMKDVPLPPEIFRQ